MSVSSLANTPCLITAARHVIETLGSITISPKAPPATDGFIAGFVPQAPAGLRVGVSAGGGLWTVSGGSGGSGRALAGKINSDLPVTASPIGRIFDDINPELSPNEIVCAMLTKVMPLGTQLLQRLHQTHGSTLRFLGEDEPAQAKEEVYKLSLVLLNPENCGGYEGHVELGIDGCLYGETRKKWTYRGRNRLSLQDAARLLLENDYGCAYNNKSGQALIDYVKNMVENSVRASINNMKQEIGKVESGSRCIYKKV